MSSALRPLPSAINPGATMESVQTLIDGGHGGVATTAAIIAFVFGLFLVRSWAVTPFATIMALDHGLNAPAILILRALSSLALAGVICWAVERWCVAWLNGAAPQSRLGRLLGRCRRAIARGSAFGNFLAAGYLLNSYVAFSLVPTLPRHRRRALIGVVAGELLSFALSLAAILGLGAVFDISPLVLTLATTGLALGLAGVPVLVRRWVGPPSPPILGGAE
jgi:hypothetical protein